MLKPEQVPDEVWTQVALRLESAGCIVPDSVAKLVAAEAINAWPGMWVGPQDVGDPDNIVILPLHEAGDE